MATNTPNFNWLIPAVGGDGDIWGDYLNSNITDQDSLIRRFMNNFINSSAPAEAQAGTLWLDNTSNPYEWKMFDGTDWITIGTLNTSTNTFATSSVNNYVGDYKFSAQTANHGSWLLCNGASISTTTYSGLFTLIGYNFGGSGASFNLPDMRGRVAGGVGTGSGLSTRTLGQNVGAETHTLSTSELPSHTHNLAVDATSSSGLIGGQQLSVFGRDGDFAWYNLCGVVGTPTFGVTGATGSNAAHNNMQPTLFVGNYFIYSGV